MSGVYKETLTSVFGTFVTYYTSHCLHSSCEDLQALLKPPFHWTAIPLRFKFWSNDTNRSRNGKSAVEA